MTAPHPGRRARRGTPRRAALVVAAVTVGTLLVASCSDDETSSTSTSTTEPAPATTRPTLPPAGPGDDQPLPVAWVTQVGGAGTDSLAGVAGRNDSVVAVGRTSGLTAPARAGTDALVLTVDAGDGTVRATTQLGAPDGPVAATSVASAPTTGLTLACGSTGGSLAATSAGGTDSWCGPVTPAGAVDGPVQLGGDADDALNGVAVSDDGGHAYAAGRTDSIFPGARDTTGGYVGSGDALLLRLDPSAKPQWVRQFGSADADDAAAVTTTDDGDALVGGTTAGTTGSSAVGGSDGWLARLDQSGMQRWLTQFGSTADDRVTAVGVGGDPTQGTETFVAGGSTTGRVTGATGATPAGRSDALAVALDASGKQLWARQFGSAADDAVTGVVFDGSTVYVAGTAGAPVVGSERVPLVPTPPGEGSTAPPSTAPPTTATPGGTGKDGFLAALDAATGEVRWISTFGSTGDDDVTGLTRTETGLLVLSGATDGQVAATAPGGGTDGFLVAFRLPQSGGGAASAV